MAELKHAIDLYKTSSFYSKYRDTYFSNKILTKYDKLRTEKMTYEDVHKLSSTLLRDFIEGFAMEVDFKDKKLLEKMIKTIYIDPDSKAVRYLNGIECSADGLLSILRIFRKHGVDMRTVEDYALYRKTPIFFFPKEEGGINQTRFRCFGDKIDHTLYDIKMYLDADSEEERNRCRLNSAYNLKKTKAWLEAIGSFENLVDWYGIKGIFVNDNYDVYDIEKGHSAVISGYLRKYSWVWSDEYYDNLKKYIECFMNK